MLAIFFLSLAAPEVIILATFGAAYDENVANTTTVIRLWSILQMTWLPAVLSHQQAQYWIHFRQHGATEQSELTAGDMNT